MKIGITGSAGFIGMHLARGLISDGHEVVSVDSLQPSYEDSISVARAKYLFDKYDHRINVLDLVDEGKKMKTLFDGCNVILHLAAWPGVRQSALYPEKFFRNNILAHSNVLKVVDFVQPQKFFYASSSSIYGNSGVDGPVSEISPLSLNPRSYYAATKLMNEIETNGYPFRGQIQCLALRFFTVFGPWGRPDMAYWKFADSIVGGKPLNLYGITGGKRNFTYISDVVDIVSKLLSAQISLSIQALNIANTDPIHTFNLVSALEESLGIHNSMVQVVERPREDVESTWADFTTLSNTIDVITGTPFETGVNRFIEWYRAYKEGIILD